MHSDTLIRIDQTGSTYRITSTGRSDVASYIRQTRRVGGYAQVVKRGTTYRMYDGKGGKLICAYWLQT